MGQVFDVNQTNIQPYSGFIIKGNKHDEIKRHLENCQVFFPGGIAGYHAFFTILENEIRNVKHYDKAQLKEMRSEGLTLNISIEDAFLKGETNPNKLHRIGIWLKHPTNINYNLLTDRLFHLKRDIINEDTAEKKPRLGGIYQDKICASMLFNNDFLNVQRQETEKDKYYYPWLKSGCSLIEEDDKGGNQFYTDWEISWRRFKRHAKNENEQHPYLFDKFREPQKGYFKKFFHIWKGEAVYIIKDEANLDWENINRFKFIVADNDDKVKKARDKDIIRIIDDVPTDKLEAYKIWLRKWLNTNEIAINIEVSKDSVSRLVFDDEVLAYYNKRMIDNMSDELFLKHNQYHDTVYNFAHGTNSKVYKDEIKKNVSYRSQGTLLTKFTKGKNLRKADMSALLAAELIETLGTKICIFDNRLANRIPNKSKEYYHKHLNLSVFEEDADKWNEMKNEGFDKFHFLVVHLSFIEAFKDEIGNKIYSEKDIKLVFRQKNFLLNEVQVLKRASKYIK